MPLSELSKTVAAAAVALLLCLVGVGILIIGIDELAETNSKTSHLYDATDACFPGVANTSSLQLPDPKRCPSSGRLYSCGCANCTLTEKCPDTSVNANQDCMCPEGLVWPDGTRTKAVTNAKLLAGSVMTALTGALFLTAVLLLLILVPMACQSMRDDDQEREYHHLNNYCCENTVARVLLVLVSPLVSALAIVLLPVLVLVLITLPCTMLLTCKSGNPKQLGSTIKFTFKSMLPYPLAAVRACLRRTHPCACWGCAEHLSRRADLRSGVKTPQGIDMNKNPAGVAREQELA